MASTELIIDDEYIHSMGSYFEKIGNSVIDKMIDGYISKLQEIKKSAIKEGEIADSLEAYIEAAQVLKDRAGKMGWELNKLTGYFITEIDDADQYLF